MTEMILYVHVADDGGIFVIDSVTGRSMWATLAGLERGLGDLRATSGSVLVSTEAGSPLADVVLDLIRSAGVPVVASPEVHPDTERNGGSTSLMSMSYMGAVAVVEDLVRRGADLETEDEGGFTAVMYAAKAGQEQSLSLLIAAGADADHGDREGSTALMLAAQHGHLGVVKKLLAAKADASRRRSDGLTAYDFAARNGHQRAAAVIMSAARQVADGRT